MDKVNDSTDYKMDEVDDSMDYKMATGQICYLGLLLLTRNYVIFSNMFHLLLNHS